MKLLKISGLGFGVAILAGQAFAGTEAGKYEITASGSYSHEWESGSGNSSSIDIYEGTLAGGYFFTDALEVKLQGTFVGIDTKGSSDYNILVMAGPDYHFRTKTDMVPYVGVYGGGFFGDGSSAGGGSSSSVGGAVDGHVGLKQFIGERTSIDYRVSYQYETVSGTSLNGVVFSVGISYQF
jgi:outer membrane protein W